MHASSSPSLSLLPPPPAHISAIAGSRSSATCMLLLPLTAGCTSAASPLRRQRFLRAGCFRPEGEATLPSGSARFTAAQSTRSALQPPNPPFSDQVMIYRTMWFHNPCCGACTASSKSSTCTHMLLKEAHMRLMDAANASNPMP